MNTRMNVIRFLNVLWLLIICIVLTGAYVYQIEEQDSPCPLCMLQRLALFCVCIGPVLNLRSYVKPKHYGISLASAVLGLAIALRQIALHICPGFPTFGYPVWGLELYSWSSIIFLSSIVGIALLLFIHPSEDHFLRPMNMYIHEKLVIGYLMVLLIMNIGTTLAICGFSSCQA